jgi:hypothetical protein
MKEFPVIVVQLCSSSIGYRDLNFPSYARDYYYTYRHITAVYIEQLYYYYDYLYRLAIGLINQ